MLKIGERENENVRTHTKDSAHFSALNCCLFIVNIAHFRRK